MSDQPGGASQTRPVLLGRVGQVRTIAANRGGKARVTFAERGTTRARIDNSLDAAVAVLNDAVQLSSSVQAADPELVLVFEALDERTDLAKIAESLGLEVLSEAEGSMEPSAEFAMKSDHPTNPYIGSCLHALCLNQQAFRQLRTHWNTYKATGQVRGLAPLRDLFDHLKDVRPWGPQDRIRAIDWDEYFAGRIDTRPHAIEIELWYRGSAAKRTRAQEAVSALIERAGGQVLNAAEVPAIGYHGLKCEVPTETLRALADGRFDQVRVVKSAEVMYLRVTGQTALPDVTGADTTSDDAAPLPQGNPVLCLLDGVPAANHRLLAGRIEVLDSDSLEDMSVATERKHGTAMASVAVWGDLNAGEAGLRRPVLVRPILAPSDDTATRQEEVPWNELAPDLMWRVFRELFDGDGTTPAASPGISVVSISVGDPTSPYDTALSAWARMLDWLSYEYGVLIVVSAGNHRSFPLKTGQSNQDFNGLIGSERRAAVIEAQREHQLDRRLLSPAEAINALTVGALHADASGLKAMAYVEDPLDGLGGASPVSAVGGGYRRSVKPDVVAPGGKLFYQAPYSQENFLRFAPAGVRGPGIRVAAATGDGETHTAGTSPAAALVARRAAQLSEVVDEVTRGTAVSRRQKAAAIKALVIHGSETVPEHDDEIFPSERLFGYGGATRDYSLGCASNEAVVMYTGSIGANEEAELLFPLPDGLSVREVKRIEATLSWLSPTNWQHRMYRRASLQFAKPGGDIPLLRSPVGMSADTPKRGATTVQHSRWETESAFGAGQGSHLRLAVKCFEQAGGLGGERVDFAVALSLWVAPSLDIDVYSQVRTQIQSRVAVAPGAGG